MNHGLLLYPKQSASTEEIRKIVYVYACACLSDVYYTYMYMSPDNDQGVAEVAVTS